LVRYNHYSRKNFGYLLAAVQKSEWIFETDDDNFLQISPDSIFCENKFKNYSSIGSGWINPYKLFSSNKKIGNIWPRGFPLEAINSNPLKIKNYSEKKFVYLYQGIANGNPDVDAIFRLINDEYIDFKFKKGIILNLNKGQFTPINSQTTWWHKSIFRLMYLPSFSTFRVTDILRGYIASAIFTHKDMAMSIFSPVVFQDRNEHNLLSDFAQELPLYTSASSFMSRILAIKYDQKMTFTKYLIKAYETAIEFGLTGPEEINTLEQWNIACDDLGISDGDIG
jgi:hypothetical protein